MIRLLVLSIDLELVIFWQGILYDMMLSSLGWSAEGIGTLKVQLLIVPYNIKPMSITICIEDLRNSHLMVKMPCLFHGTFFVGCI